MKITIIPDTIKIMSQCPSVTCEVVTVLEHDELKANIHGVLTISFADQSSARVYKSLMEKEVIANGRGKRKNS